MLIGVDARPLEANPTGIGVYTREILSRMPAEANVILYSNKPIASGLSFESRLSLRVSGPLWRNTVLPRQLKSDGVDVYWSPIGTLPIVPIKPRTVITIHDLLWIDYPQTLSLRDRIGRRIQMKKSISSADRIIAVSEFTRGRLLDEYMIPASRISLITESPRFFESSLRKVPARQRSMIAFGGDEPRKNLQFLIDCFEKSNLPDHGWRLKTIGKGAPKLRRSESVEALDYVPDTVLKELFRNAGAVCFPSLYEGFGLPVLEAMAYNVPVLISDIQPFREFDLSKEAMFNPSDIDSCVQALERLTVEDDVAKFVSRQSDVLVNWPTWDEVAKATFESLKDASV